MSLYIVKHRVLFIVLAGFFSAGTLLTTVYVALTLLTGQPHATNKSPTIIMLENAHQGTTSWKIPSGKVASTEIQAYASATSVSPGQTLTFYVSTYRTGTPYTIDIYRLGWYGGSG